MSAKKTNDNLAGAKDFGDHDYTVKVYWEDNEWVAESIGGSEEVPLCMAMVVSRKLESALEGVFEEIRKNIVAQCPPKVEKG